MSKSYTPRKCSKRWLDADCPAGVLAIFDNGGKTADRYDVIYSDPICGPTYADTVLSGRGMSENPFHPQGVGMFFELSAHEVACYRYRNKHQYARWSSLPELVKACVRQDLA